MLFEGDQCSEKKCPLPSYSNGKGYGKSGDIYCLGSLIYPMVFVVCGLIFSDFAKWMLHGVVYHTSLSDSSLCKDLLSTRHCVRVCVFSTKFLMPDVIWIDLSFNVTLSFVFAVFVHASVWGFNVFCMSAAVRHRTIITVSEKELYHWFDRRTFTRPLLPCFASGPMTCVKSRSLVFPSVNTYLCFYEQASRLMTQLAEVERIFSIASCIISAFILFPIEALWFIQFWRLRTNLFISKRRPELLIAALLSFWFSTIAWDFKWAFESIWNIRFPDAEGKFWMDWDLYVQFALYLVNVLFVGLSLARWWLLFYMIQTSSALKGDTWYCSSFLHVAWFLTNLLLYFSVIFRYMLTGGAL